MNRNRRYVPSVTRHPSPVIRSPWSVGRGPWALAALMLLASLTGCGGGKKAIATVNGETIPEDEFLKHAQTVDAVELSPALQPGAPVPPRAGEFALKNMIDEALLMQYAKEKHVVPTEAEISSYMAFVKKYPQNPNLTMVAQDPFRSDTDLRNQIKQILVYRKLLVQMANIQPADLQRQYDILKNQLQDPAKYHLRIIVVRDKNKAQQILDRLNHNVPFETEALKESEDKRTAAQNGDAGTIPEPVLQQRMKSLYDAVKNMKPGDYTKAPVPLQAASGPTTPGSSGIITEYVLAQLVGKTPARTPTLDEVKPILEIQAVQQKDFGAAQRLANAMTEVRQKAKIEIADAQYQTQYQSLINQIKAPAAPPASVAPAPGGPGGPAPSAPAPTPPASGAPRASAPGGTPPAATKK